jgi:hypothetical protein
MRFAVPLLLLLAVLPTPAVAAFYSGNDFLSYCNAPETAAARGKCTSFVAGAFDASELLLTDRERDRSRFFCVPPSVTLGQLTDVLLKYVRENPAERHETAVSLFFKAIWTAWPCPQ